MKTTTTLFCTLLFALSTFAQQTDSTVTKKDSTKKKPLYVNKYNADPLGKSAKPSKNGEIDLKASQPQKKVETNYIKKDGRIVGGETKIKLGKN
jgi:hypothetical protein